MDNNEFKRRMDRLVILLEDWADWQRGYSGARGFSNHATMLQSDRRVRSDSWEELLDRLGEDICRMIDASVDDLPPWQAAAIHKRYGISAVFRFPRGNYEDLLLDAHSTLMVSLPKKGVVI